MPTVISTVKKDRLINLENPEISLLLNCARSKLTSQHQANIQKLLNQKIDWQYLIQIAKRHKILSLLYANLSSSNIELNTIQHISDRQLQQAFQNNTQRNLQLTAELIKILKHLQKNNVEAISIKGPILAILAYGKYGLRAISDLDIVVRKKDFAKAQQLLMLLGYQASTLNKAAYYQQAQYYKISNIKMSVDLHYEFAPKNHFATVDSSLFWQNVESYSLANQKLNIFSLEYTLIHLCLEGIKEHWRWLNRLCDLSELICNQKIDWNLLLINAIKLDKKEAVLLGLYLAHTTLNTPLPKFILQEIDRCFKYQISQEKIYRFLFRKEFNLLAVIEWYLFLCQAFSGKLARFKYLLAVINDKLSAKN